jgi:DNA-binding response OmpR family regulator
MVGARMVLIVEDDVDLRRMFRTALTLAGFRVLEAGDGLQALHVLDAARPDLVILDLGLPIVSGSVVRQEIAAQAHTRHIPVVVVTGTDASRDGMDVSCLLRKPVSPDDVVHAVRTCLSAGSAQGT